MIILIRDTATGLLGFFALTIVAALIHANVTELASRKGWNVYFSRFWDRWRSILPDWQRLRSRWGFWLTLGSISSIALVLWVITTFPTAVEWIEGMQLPAMEPISSAKRKVLRWDIGNLLDVQFRLTQSGTLEEPWFLVMSSADDNKSLQEQLAMIIHHTLPFVQTLDLPDESFDLMHQSRRRQT
jgi:hypothetical protein